MVPNRAADKKRVDASPAIPRSPTPKNIPRKKPPSKELASFGPDQLMIMADDHLHAHTHVPSQTSTFTQTPNIHRTELDHISLGSYSLMQDQCGCASLDADDSGRGSWTSCSSGSHDNIQSIPQRIGCYDSRIWEMVSEGLGMGRSQSATPLGYWADESEGDTGTIKHQGGNDEVLAVQKGTIGRKEGRFREPPPTPPGYTAASLIEVEELSHNLVHSHTHGQHPPDYKAALQRYCLIKRSLDLEPPPQPRPTTCMHGYTVLHRADQSVTKTSRYLRCEKPTSRHTLHFIR